MAKFKVGDVVFLNLDDAPPMLVDLAKDDRYVLLYVTNTGTIQRIADIAEELLLEAEYIDEDDDSDAVVENT